MLNTINGVMVPPEGTILEILAATSTFSSYLGYVKTAGLEYFLNNPVEQTCTYWIAGLTLTRNHAWTFKKFPFYCL